MADEALFPDLERNAPRPRARPREPLVCEPDWTVVDHVCKRCFGRLVGRAAESGRFYRCTNCGATSPDDEPPTMRTGGRGHPTICACSIRFGGRDAGIRCVVNTARGPDNPAEIVARQL